MTCVPWVGIATYTKRRGPVLVFPIVQPSKCADLDTQRYSTVATPWSMTRMRSVQVIAVTYVTAWGSSVTWGSPHRERDRDRGSKMTWWSLPMLALFGCPSEYSTCLIFKTGCGTCLMNWQCMCQCKISVTLTVVLEGKFEFGRPDATQSCFNSPKQNTVINPLKTKRRLLHLKTQFVPLSKPFSSRL